MGLGKAPKLFSVLLCASLLVTLPAGTAGAQQPRRGETAPAAEAGTPPTVSAIYPASAFNDLDSPVTITGSDFATDTSGAPPTIALGNTALTNVTWVSSTTLTASIPWGMNPGAYTLTITNPDGGTGSLVDAFTVAQGIGQWNGGSLFGGEVRQIMMKPGDPNTLYAPAYGIAGLFRSRDAGEHWSYVSDDVFISNSKFAVDPLHPGWIYGYANNGLWRSQDDGDTWTNIMKNLWPDGLSHDPGQIYISPNDPNVLFLGTSPDPASGSNLGLIKSNDGGVTWKIVEDMVGISVLDIAFHPTDSSQMVLVTQEGRAFHSIDQGDTWSEVTKPPVSSMGRWGTITYNPYRAGEVWIGTSIPGKIYRSTDAAFTSWQDVTPPDGQYYNMSFIKFTSADSAYTTRHHSTDGGLTWQFFGPFTSYGEMTFDPNNPQVGYIGDDIDGVQKTTDGGQTWEIKNQGLTGMLCTSLEVSRADPLRVYATFQSGGPGIYRSTDGANTWTYLPIAGSDGVRRLLEDPLDPQRIYVMSVDGFYVSTDAGEHWSDLGWNVSPAAAPDSFPWVMDADPYQPGHLLVGFVVSPYDSGQGWLYSSTDYGVSWQTVSVPQQLNWIHSITFDPQTQGLVYLSTSGTGFYRSTDHGTTWERIDDLLQSEMQNTQTVAIATHPQSMLLVDTSTAYPYRSLDGGATWKRTKSSPSGGIAYIFANGDSTRLYCASLIGLYTSSDGGDSWTPAAGALGHIQTSALGYGVTNGQTIIYAATAGGNLTTTANAAVDTPGVSGAKGSNLVNAGIYRFVPRTQASKTFYSSSAQDGWVLESGENTNKGGTVNSTAASFNIGDNAAKKQYRGILSFNTSGLPDHAVITKVILKVKKAAVVGAGNPLNIFQGLMAEIKTGFFSTKAGLQSADFQAPASHVAFGPFKPSPVNNWYSINLTSAKAYINTFSTLAGLTQIRLRFKLDDNNNAVANILSLYSGNASSPANRPQLVITYYVP